MSTENNSRPPYLQVAHALRASILTRKFQPGDRLPSSRELAEQYNVARMTIQRALQLLHDEGLIISRTGTGIFVRDRAERPTGLRPHIEAAFQRTNVSIDFAGFSGETLHGAIQEPLDNVRHGLVAPERIHVRVLIPTAKTPWALPCRTDDLQDDPAFRERGRQISSRHTTDIAEAVAELQRLNLIKEGRFELREHRCAPLFKLYILNNEQAFFAFYPIQPHTVVIEDEPHSMFDLMGKDATLFHHAATSDEESVDSQFVAQARQWFDSLWSTQGQPP